MFKKILSNTLWLSIGKFGGSLVSFLLVPLYTYYLDTEEYGFVDLIIVTCVFLVPIITCQVGDAIQTFLLKKEEKADVIFSNSIFIFLTSWVFSFAFFSLIQNYFGHVTIYLYLLIFFQAGSNLLFNLNKGLDRLNKTTWANLSESLALLVFMIFLLRYLGYGLNGFIYALLLSKLLGFIVYLVITPFWTYFSFKLYSRNMIKIILLFSLPLIPNMIGWWINNVSDRYLINYFLGFKSNGLYAVGVKIPSLINIFGTILVTSWRIAVLQNYDKKKSETFKLLSNIFVYLFLLIGAVIILFKDQIFEMYIKSAEYAQGLSIVGVLMASSILSAISSFFGVVYLGEKDTKLAAYTTILGGIINIGLNVYMIPIYGILGAAYSTLVSFLMVVVLRYLYVYKRTNIRLPIFFILLFVTLVLSVILETVNSENKQYFIFMVSTIVIFSMYTLIKYVLKKNNFKEIF